MKWSLVSKISLDERKEVADYCRAKRKWFEEATSKYGVCAFVAYLEEQPTGLVEFLPVNAVSYPEERPRDTVFILCSYVAAKNQKKGVGRNLFRHLIEFLKTSSLSYFGGRKAMAIEVYVPKVDPSWPPNIVPDRKQGVLRETGF